MQKLFPLLFIFASSIAISAPVEINQFDSPQQEADYRALIQELRCPQCQNNNIADSNATISTDMRAKTLELLKEGKNKSEVVDYMIERYGNFVTYNPPMTPATIVLWVLPLLLITLGFGLVLRRKKAKPQAVNSSQNIVNTTQNLNQDEQERLNQILNNKEDK
ncbi:cytochrome c-type biogenesis protein CcmH [Mannheimia sp. AT1]|uniref:Cytochrome c-type biogenesis protein n=1 Tax=Mannheimia cairinae TaxID=3025936 RepID=A0ABT5MR12_9PAST|nr:cytochrome c-type biogenesis protein [Mannheimia cairinae]MDD0823283.1 cytochrome c-type biogenesis protein CcmH [Mannheimia cairinae]MDD0826907.1 cytochrome c-type biogenesis protein CcmH [Mannheimia cairinae]